VPSGFGGEAVSFQTDAGVGDDLLPDLGFAGDVGGGLARRAGRGFHALLAANRTSGAPGALVTIAFSAVTISDGTFDETTTAYQLVAA
jgi:hypothetical protein